MAIVQLLASFLTIWVLCIHVVGMVLVSLAVQPIWFADFQRILAVIVCIGGTFILNKHPTMTVKEYDVVVERNQLMVLDIVFHFVPLLLVLTYYHSHTHQMIEGTAFLLALLVVAMYGRYHRFEDVYGINSTDALFVSIVTMGCLFFLPHADRPSSVI